MAMAEAVGAAPSAPTNSAAAPFRSRADERRARRLAVLCAHLRPSQLSASLCSGARRPRAAEAAAVEEEEVSGDKGCVFCAIVRGESPRRQGAFSGDSLRGFSPVLTLLDLVYEDDVCLCILDSNPLSHGHSLIIPKCHFPSLEATPPPVVAAMCSKVPFLSNAIMKAAQCDSFNLVVNNGSAAGQVIFHTHFHIIPRKAGDQLWPSEEAPLERNQETIGLLNSIKEHLCASPCGESQPKDLRHRRICKDY
uniref:HIT domain-containing protein n=1 Tax=Ananas comosus var. bracteatus TaxID=296719 RepID=A0A6V7NMY8_ANACO|nr:unnamed protein product [Ananas comosus var. bracteatus]